MLNHAETIKYFFPCHAGMHRALRTLDEIWPRQKRRRVSHDALTNVSASQHDYDHKLFIHSLAEKEG